MKVLLQNQRYCWNANTTKVYLGHNPPGTKNPKWGNRKLTKNSGFQKFISSILYDAIVEFNGTIIFKSEQKRRDIARKLILHHGCLELTIVDNTAISSSFKPVK